MSKFLDVLNEQLIKLYENLIPEISVAGDVIEDEGIEILGTYSDAIQYYDFKVKISPENQTVFFKYLDTREMQLIENTAHDFIFNCNIDHYKTLRLYAHEIAREFLLELLRVFLKVDGATIYFNTITEENDQNTDEIIIEVCNYVHKTFKIQSRVDYYRITI